MTRIASLVAWIYGGLCAGALLLIPAATYGWMGIPSDPDAGNFAFILGLPWSLARELLSSPRLWLAILPVVAGMAINIVIILSIGRRRSRPRRPL